MRFDLCGKWQFRQMDKEEWLPATVPGCNYLDLMSNDVIEDPFYGTNEHKCGWVAEKDWVYRRYFDVSEDGIACDMARLTFECLDTLATVKVNGNTVLEANNCHICYTVDVKEWLRIGENELVVEFASPVNYVNKMQAIEKCPANANGLNGIPHIRKPQCHFGWDWGPVLTPSGVSGNVYIDYINSALITDVRINQKHENGQVEIAIVSNIESFADDNICRVVVTSPSGEKISKGAVIVDGKASCDILISQPELWSIRELNDRVKQPLYEVEVCVMNGETVCHSVCKRIGLRTIKLEQKADEYGKNFQFVLNGTSIFAKGANWIPADSFNTRADRDVLEYYIKSAVDSNFNMLRVWGGGYYESEDFYDLCDEYGILVWQDFAFACQPYPFFMDDFRENVRAEVVNVVKRIRNHPSLALWCGNNEIELMAIAWKLRTNYTKWTEKFFYHILPEWLREVDDVTSYIGGTPIGVGYNNGFSNDNVGDTHLWAVWHGLQPMNYYRKRMTRFCSEFGFESLPDLKTVKTFAEEKDYSLTSPVFSSHQKCMSGNMKMAFYIASRFRLPEKFEDYIYLSQICQQECIRDATEHWRRNKGRCNGSLFWQYNDCWPVCSWASVDYYGNYKALQYTSKHFFAPLTLSIEDTKQKIDLWAINDKLKAYDLKVEARVLTFDGEEVWKDSFESSVDINSSRLLRNINIADIKAKAKLRECVFVADMWANGEFVCRKTMLFDKEKNVKLPNVNVRVDCKIEGNEAVYTLTADKFARLVQVYSKNNTLPFSDNFFDIVPNESVVIKQTLNGNETVEELLQNITITTATDIVPKATKFSDFCFRMKVFLTPINFFNWVYYNAIPGKIKVEE